MVLEYVQAHTPPPLWERDIFYIQYCLAVAMRKGYSLYPVCPAAAMGKGFLLYPNQSGHHYEKGIFLYPK